MNSDDKAGLIGGIVKDDEQTPLSMNDPPKTGDKEQSSELPLRGNMTPEIAPEDELEDNTEYNWGDYEDYKFATDEQNLDRSYEEIIAINKITKYYKKYLLEQKKDLKDKDELKAITLMLNHQKLFEENKFTWEIALPDMSTILAFAKTTISKFFADFDFEMLDHSVFQKVFPLKMIDQYLSIVNRVYGKPVYDNALRFQTNLIEIFLWHHLRADTRFHPKITTVDINLIDPFLRIKIREKNRRDPVLSKKYFNSLFDLKKFSFKMLDLYFPNVTWRYVGGGQEMHRWSLLLMLDMFELGYFEADEMPDLVNLLLQKLENLLVLEKRSYQDFSTTLVNYPKFIETLKAYFYECKQIVAAICIQIAMLLNDQAFMESYPLFNKELSMTDIPQKGKAWSRAYFTNSSVGNILNRIMTTYLCQLTESKIAYGRNKMFDLLNDFIMLTMDIENDINYVSSKVVTQTLLEFYISTPNQQDQELAKQQSSKLCNLVDQMNFLNLSKKKTFTQAAVTRGLKEYLVVLAQIQNEQRKLHFKHLLGLEGVPNILLSLMSSIISGESNKELEGLCGLALLETCKSSAINLVLVTSEKTNAHWDYFFDKRKLTAVILQTSMFENNLNLFYIHKSLISWLMENLKESIPSNWELNDEEINTPQKWFDNFKKLVVDEKKDAELDEVVSFYTNCRFICELVSNKDINYETKFNNFNIQEMIAKPFFTVLLPLICDENFLMRYESAESEATKNLSPYIFRPGFRGASADVLNAFIEKKTTHGINESELRCAVFEVAMLTMKLLNKACTGLYSGWMYKFHAKAEVETILERTRYILDLPHCAAEYRMIIVQFYTNFRIFPNNNVICGRLTEWKDPLVPTREERVPSNHKDGIVINQIIGELELVEKFVVQWDRNPEEKGDIIKYYYNGLFGILYKYFKGLYSCYAQDGKLDSLLTSLEKLKEAVDKVAPTLSSKFGIPISFEDDGQKSSNIGLFSLIGSMNKVTPSPTSNQGKQDKGKEPKRFADSDENLYPKLGQIRDMCENFIDMIEYSMNNHENYNTEEILNFMGNRYSRPSAIFSAKTNLEPWGISGTTTSGTVSKSRSKQVDSIQATLNLANILVASTGLISADLRYYYSLMDIYQEEKLEALGKPIDENIFLKFLESGKEYVPNLIAFIGHIVRKFYGGKIFNAEGETLAVSPDSKEGYMNLDFVIKTFLQNEVLHSMVAFFSKVIADSSNIKDALYDALTKDEGTNKALATDMLTTLYATVTSLMPIVLNKTFMDYEHQVIAEKYLSLCMFFKNICENNCQKFKVYLGTFVPTSPALPTVNTGKKNMVFDSYVKLESSYAGYNIHTSKDPRLRVDDKPEVLQYISAWAKMVSEFVNGPCYQNQKQIFIYRTDFYSGTIKRMVDNIDSSFYQHKNVVVDYIDSLLEGNSPDIVKHFASNFTFDIIFDLICDSIKRLYIYTTVQGKHKKYRQLAQRAREHSLKVQQEKKQKELSMKDYFDKEMDLYLHYEANKGTEKAVENILVEKAMPSSRTLTDYDNERMITQEIIDYVKVEDYKEILQVYLRNTEFSRHVILSAVYKLNEFMNRFASIVAGFKISLENVYHDLIDVYGSEVPAYILNKVGPYERKENQVGSEKLVLFMFLCKITSEIELYNPESNIPIKISYPLIPKTFFLTQTTKKELMDTADTGAMTMDLILRYKYLELEMNYNLNLYRSNPLIYRMTSDEFFFYIKFVKWLFAFALNIVFIVFYRRDSETSTIQDEGLYVIWGLSGLIGASSLASLVMWFLSRYKQKAEVASAQWNATRSIGSSKVNRFFTVYIKESMMFQIYPVLFTFYIICCALGVFVQPFFFTLMLLTVVTLSTTMNYVVKAITTHFDKLSQTVFLMLMVIYCYSVLSAEYFFDRFTSNESADGTGTDIPYYNCTQLWECVMYVFNNGLRMGGGIGDVTNGVNPLDSEGRYTAKFFFDVAFFMLINVISLNIIFGIIIDTFADMRQKQDERGKQS
jgi:hypothetical protein